jgi:DNA-binding NarL/FixJ family response regulator
LKILIVDDHDAIRSVLRRTIESRTTFEIVGEACDGEQAVQMVEKLQPDVVIMDINMPKVDGIEATRTIKARWPKVLILACSIAADDESIQTMIASGASGYIIKGDVTTDLVYSLQQMTQKAPKSSTNH